MGYRNDVAVEMYTYNPETNVAVIHLWFDSQEVPDFYKPMFSKTPRGISFRASDIKYLPEFSAIDRMIDDIFEAFKTNFTDEDDGSTYNFEFMRLGEDDDDVESDCAFEFNYLSLHKEIRREND